MSADAPPPAEGLAALEAELASFPRYVVTTQVCAAIFGQLPGAPSLPNYATLEACAAAVTPDVPRSVIERARLLAEEPAVAQALFAAKSIDTGDTGISVVTGVRSALSLFMGKRGPGSGADAQQRTDAALKALGIAYLITRLIPRAPAERVAILKSIPAGQELLLYFTAVEIALPFDEAVRAADGRFIADLVAERTQTIAGRLLSVIGTKGVADATETLDHLVSTLDEVAMHVAPHTEKLANAAKGVLPAAFGSGKALQDIVAAGADALPAYRYLCARLAAESRLALAKLDLMPDIPMEPLPLLEPTAVVAPPPPVPPELVAAASGDPFAAPVQDVDPFAADPFAEMASGPSPALPVEELPADKRLNGVYLRTTPGGDLWVIFTREGVFTNHPPAGVPPDWPAHRAAGHQVGTYVRDGDTVRIALADGSVTESQVARQTYALALDGILCDRCDYALAGQILHGTWRSGDRSLRFGDDGSFTGPEGEGTYALGTGDITFTVDGAGQVVTLYSTLKPTTRTPRTLYIAGEPWALAT